MKYLKRLPLILSFAIIAVGFGMSFHRSLTGNGLLEENLDTHILAQLDGAGDDTGGGETGGNKTGGDDTGGDDTNGGPNGPDSLYYLKDQKNCKIDKINYTDKSDAYGRITYKNETFSDFLPNTYYELELTENFCIYATETYCNTKDVGVFKLSSKINKNIK